MLYSSAISNASGGIGGMKLCADEARVSAFAKDGQNILEASERRFF